eukprot:CAMPEP_0196131904 /NCGR_PEP_ID=MMETSP0910-20130528/1719_1 /TAXON_ID=49265 /ORGANISM="Thalassiosira rotula, Strain GSO102" /LENGTH=357 /DNA_ID=CAMNT_0041391421 /DNA_START=123 /DNA_END=1196 /DNA_ORIENTATION=-
MKDLCSHDVNAIRNSVVPRQRGLRGVHGRASGVAFVFLSLAVPPQAQVAHAFSSSSSSRISRQQQSDLKWNHPPTFSSTITPLFSTLSPDEESANVEKRIVNNAVVAKDDNDTNDDNNNNIQLPFDMDTSLLTNIASIAIVLIIGSLGIQTLGSMGMSLVKQLSTDVAIVTTNLLSIASAILAAIFGMLKFLVPVVGKGIADGATAAAPVVMEATQRAAETAAPVVMEATQRAADTMAPVVMEATSRVAETAGPVLDSVGRAVDDGIVTPFQQAVDASIVDPLQGAAESVGRAVDGGIVTPFQQAVDASANVVGKAVDDTIVNPIEQVKQAMPTVPSMPALPEMPETSVRIGDVKLF